MISCAKTGLEFVAYKVKPPLIVQKFISGTINETLTARIGFKSHSYYHKLIETLPVAVYTCDKHGFIQFYNKAAVQLWGREPIIGKDLWCGSWKIFSPDGSPVLLDECPMALALKEGKSIRGVEIVVERPDGVKVNVLPHPDPILDEAGEITGAVNMLVDITELKQTKDKNALLKQYNNQLEQFAYAASHDMQEPLRKIQTFSGLLLQRNEAQLDEQGKKYLNKITNSAERMNSIIQDLLDYSRETRHDELFVKTDLNRILSDIQSDLELMITNKGATIVVEKMPMIRAIPSQINRLFYNLIQNALKFSQNGKPPYINVSVGKDVYFDSEQIPFMEIRVQDNGIGFEPQYEEKIFHLFQRLNDRHSFSGNGIGLALCKKIVDNHHGSIMAKSKPGSGTTFTVRLPIELVAENENADQ